MRGDLPPLCIEKVMMMQQVTMTVNGYTVQAVFAETSDQTILQHAQRILLADYSSRLAFHEHAQKLDVEKES